MLKNSNTTYGLTAILLHWFSAVLVFTVFGLGLWIEGLDDYYDPWYKKGPDLHMSLGLLLLVVIIFRLIWRWLNPKPVIEAKSKLEKTVAVIVHYALYGLMIFVPIAGFLLTTSDGKSVSLFGLMDIQPLVVLSGSEDLLAEMHEIAAFSLIGLVALHFAAAMKHHVIDKDNTLKKMLGMVKGD